MRRAVVILLLAQALAIAGCAEPARRIRAACLLLDLAQLRSQRAQAVFDYFLGALRPGEYFGVACLGTGSFSTKDAIAKVSLDTRPSVASQQKLLLRKRLDQFSPSPRPGGNLDVAGPLLYALAYLNETGVEDRYVVLFVNLRREQIPEPVKDFPLQMDRCQVLAIDVDEREITGRQQAAALKHLEAWKEWVEAGGGRWQVVTDLSLLATIFPGS